MSEQPIGEPMKFPWRYAVLILFGIFLLGLFNSSRSGSGVFLFVLYVLPLVVAFIAAFAVMRERHRTWSAGNRDVTQPGADEAMIFPWRYALLNVALLFLIDIVYWPASNIRGYEVFLVGVTIFFVPLFVLACLGVQRILFYSLGKFVTNKTFWVCFLFAPSFMIAVLCSYESLPTTIAHDILPQSKAAPMPKDAHGIRAADERGWNGYGPRYLRFKASPETIDEFINRSAQLQGLQPQACSKGPFPRWKNRWGEYDMYFLSAEKPPPWFPEEVMSNGRFLGFERGTSVSGFILTDDVNNIVYVYLTGR